MQTEEMRLDGNAAGGALREIFISDMTTAVVTCRTCGKSGPLGKLLEYGHDMGIILRCPSCQGAVMRLVHMPGRLHLDMSGMSLLVWSDGDATVG